MTLPSFAKSIAGALVGALGPVATDAMTNPQGVTTGTGGLSALGALIGWAAVYFPPNGKAKDAVSGLVVTVKTDVAKFLAAFMAGIPTLVETAAKAALEPAAPVPATPAAPVEQVVEPSAAEGTPDAAPAAPPVA